MTNIKLKANKSYPVNNQDEYDATLKSIPNPKELKINEIDLSDNKEQIAILFSQSSMDFAHTTKIDGQNFIIPEPNITILYFTLACQFHKLIKENKDSFLRTANIDNIFNSNKESLIKNSFSYFSLVSGFTVFLFTSLESFINSKIDKNSQIIKRDRTFGDYEYILRYCSFYHKIKHVLNKQTFKNFAQNNKVDYEIISELKKLRDELIHAKPENKHLDYDKIIKKSLTIDFDKALAATRNFINYYEPNLIEDEN